MNHAWIIVAIGVLVFWAIRTGKIKASVSIGNPNYPASQRQFQYPTGPQGPNDGSNNYMGNGHYANAW